MKMFREVYSRHRDFLQACVGSEFELVGSLLDSLNFFILKGKKNKQLKKS